MSNSPLYSWRDSAPVVALSDFLKGQAGMKLVILDRRPAIHFEPGVAPWDGDRWQAARVAVDLLFEAAADIKYLANKGLITIPDHPGYVRLI